VTAIVVHGGAGTVTADRHDRLRAGVRAAAAAGHAILAAGGPALDAVVAAVRVLEDDPELNAGTGSVLTRDGQVETDAAVMDGATGRVGGVGAVPDLGCAIALARAVLERGEHVLLVGPAAWRFADEVGIARAAPGALVTERQRARWQARAGTDLGGTVGAVARDASGRLAAATSTGGTFGKRSGRVGDSPVPGAGTWADERVAVSATGDGEAILRVALAHAIAAAVGSEAEFAVDRLIASPDLLGRAVPPEPVRRLIDQALQQLRARTGGSAGVIAVTCDGIAYGQLSATMPVAWITSDGAGDDLGRHVKTG
jgi:beta-aspartyl-peptidase (threonine type)